MSLDELAGRPAPELHHRPLDPLPAVLTRAARPTRRKLAPESRLLLLLVLLLGNPWSVRLIAPLRPRLSPGDDEWLTAFGKFVGYTVVEALTWPLYLSAEVDERTLIGGDWIGYQVRTATFLLLAVVLLNKLAGAGNNPAREGERLSRWLAVFGGVLGSSVIAGLVASPIISEGLGWGDPTNVISVEFWHAVQFGLVFGNVLGRYAVRRPTPTRERHRTTPLGGT